ncbi:TonB-dependent receptor [Kineobactrum salinum]|uniref:TonB-dependent receptor n=1 Tax=Kineobactrum salinum TaxID=2708301 RepID=A0A6C0TZ96_9GAMM|nr:TonB-dependent receptor [Kineobactrum salinum]QIB64978.1 TonB-dependent receptor [Kineobactrum salinum]
MDKKEMAGVVAAIVGTLVGSSAIAQQSAGKGRAVALEEVVVTAQKRAENVQDIPIAVSALSEETLRQSSFDGVADLSFMVPSLQFGNFGPVSFLNIRGIGSADNFAGSDPGVAIHIDGVYIGRPVGALFNAFDTERVEVLRGPQGTLYGRNATGGSINLITKKPQDEFGGEVEVTAGDYDLRRVRGAINIPVSDAVRARIVGFNEERDGFTENTYPGGADANDLDNWGIRGHLDIDLSDNINLLLSATHVDIGGVGTQPEVRDPFSTGELSPPINSLVAGPLPQLAPGIPPELAFYTNADGSIPVNDQRPFTEAVDHPRSTDNKLTLLSATLQWDFDDFTFKSITGYAESEYLMIQDADASTAPNTVHIPEEQSEQFSQEIQFISDGDGPLRWIGGLYYFREDASRISTMVGPRLDAIHELFIANDFSFGGPGFSEDFAFRVGGDVETESFAVFGESSYDITDHFTLTVGLRYTDDEKEAINSNIQLSPLVLTRASTSSEEVTGKVALNYQITNDVMVYGSFSRGYKSGGIIQVATDPVAAAFKPEFVDTLEVGFKSQLWDVLQLNAAIYTSDYTDLQTSAEGAFGQLGGNAGEASIEGAELEWKWLINDMFTFDGSFSYLDGVYDQLMAFDPLDQNFSAGVVDYSGNDLPRAPEFTYNLGVSGYWNLDHRGHLTARMEGSYTDEMYYEFTNRPEVKADDYYNLNLRLMWASADEKYNAEIYCTNLTDEVQEGNLLLGFSLGVSTQPNGFAEPGQEYVTYNAPRQFGVKFGYRF